MKKWALFLGLILLAASGCSAEKFQDNQVYVVDGNAENQTDDFVDWIDGEGLDPFQTTADEQPALAAGEIFLTMAPDEMTYYTMQITAPVKDTVIIDENPVSVTIMQVTRESGQQQVVAQDIPFVNKAAWNSTGEIVAFCGGSHLSVYDCKKGRLILQEELADTIITDFFWSPVDNNKMYIEQPGTAGGGLYYVDPQKRVELYETKEKIYYKALMQNAYYYATQWRSSEKDSDGALYTVLADADRKVIKIIGRGSYKDSYRKSVLLSGEDRFGLYFVADINQVSKGFNLTDAYIYDAKFLANGQIAYVIRKDSVGVNAFELHICDKEGKVLQVLDVSGSSFYLSADGRYGFVSGPQAEIVDFEKLQSMAQNTIVSAGNDEDLLSALRGAVMVYAGMRLGHQANEADIERYFVDSDKAGGMAQAEIWARQPKSNQESQVFYRAVLDREHSLISAEGDIATCHIELNGMSQQSGAFTEQLAWDVIKRNGHWQVFGLSTFTREQQRSTVLTAAEQFLQSGTFYLPISVESIHWRQVQYWQKDKSGLAGWLSDGEWAKADGDMGGLIVWLKQEGDTWQVKEVWYDGGWVYPKQLE